MNDLDGISLKQLRLFVALHRIGHLGEVASELSITQSAASRRLSELETRIGQKLFAREGRRLVPTDAGHTFLRYAESALQKLRNGLDMMAGNPSSERSLHIGALPSVANALMPSLVMALRSRMPGLSIRIDTGAGDQLLPRLRTGDLDAMIGRMPQLGDTLSFIPLQEDQLAFFVWPGHPLLEGKMRLETLADYPLLLPPKSAVIRPAIEDFFAVRGLALPPDRIEIASSLIARSLLENLHGVWAISQGAGHGLGLERLSLDTTATTGAIGITTRLEDAASTELRVLTDILEKQTAK